MQYESRLQRRPHSLRGTCAHLCAQTWHGVFCAAASLVAAKVWVLVLMVCLKSLFNHGATLQLCSIMSGCRSLHRLNLRELLDAARMECKIHGWRPRVGSPAAGMALWVQGRLCPESHPCQVIHRGHGIITCAPPSIVSV